MQTTTTTTLRARILNAIDRLANGSGYASLTRLRAELADLDRNDLTRALLDMDNAHVIQLDPDANRLGLTAEDRAAAIWLGGEYMHLVSTW